MKRVLLFICLTIAISSENLFCQYWQEQIVLQGNVITQCFDENDDVLFSSPLSNGKYAVCRYSVEKDSIDKVLLVTNKPVNFIDVLSDGTIMAFQDFQLLRSTDKGKRWEGISNQLTFPFSTRNYNLIEFSNYLIIWEKENYFISFNNGITWTILQYQDKRLQHVEATISGLLAIELDKHSPIFSSDFGLTWQKTNLDTLRLFNFIYSNSINSLYALSFPRDEFLYKSSNGGQFWEKLLIPTDTIIKSFDVDSEGNLFIMDAKNNLYQFLYDNYDLKHLSSDSPFITTSSSTVLGERYRVGIFLDKNNHVYYYDNYNNIIWKYNKEVNLWTDFVKINYLGDQPKFYFTRSFQYSKKVDKVIINAYTIGFDFIDLKQPQLKSVAIPNGLVPVSEYYDLSPNGDLAFANYYTQFYDSDSNRDTIESVIARYSYSKDSGFSRYHLLSDTNHLYNEKNEYSLNIYYYEDKVFSNLSFDKNNVLTAVGNNKTITADLSNNVINIINSNEFSFRIPDVLGISPDGFKYAFFSDLHYEKPKIFKSRYNQLFYRKGINDSSWELMDSSFQDTNCLRTDKILFMSDDKIFLDGVNDCSSMKILSSDDHGETWNKFYFSSSQDNSSTLYIDQMDNIYYTLYYVVGGINSYKNWLYWGDTCSVVATRNGDIFAKVGYDSKHYIYSSDYGESWIDYPTFYPEDIKSNDFGDVYYTENSWENQDQRFKLFKFIREPNPKPHPLSDTTVYTIVVNVEENENKIAQEFKIFPNPASDYIEIKLSESLKLSESYNIKIYNTYGQCVLSVEAGTEPVPTERIDISHLPIGIYFVRVGDDCEKFFVIR